jgi:predicted HD superfamily hydrolase involved in NAD metabolism
MIARTPQKRIAHVYGVLETARDMADRFGENRAQAEVAALLHDYAKAMPAAEQLAEARRRNLIVDSTEELSPGLLHGPVGAALLEEQGLVTDPAVLDAIRWHTTGRVGMSRLAMILYVADAIEPTRDYPGVDEIREAARRDLAEATLKAADAVIRFVVDNGWLMHMYTVQTRNWLLTR